MARVAVLYNVDFEDRPYDAGFDARADVADVARAVMRALKIAKHDPHLVPVDGDLQIARTTLQDLAPDCVLNLCESLAGDARLESAIPILLEHMKIPYSGSPPEALSASLYKDRVKEKLVRAGISTPEACVMRSSKDRFALAFPVIVKPSREDGSAGIDGKSVVKNDRALRRRVAMLVERFSQPCLVERYIEGREINVAFFGFPNPRVLPLHEIDFSRLAKNAPRIVTYDAKWKIRSRDDRGTRPVLASLSKTITSRVHRVALAAFKALGLRDYGRIDVRIDENGTPWVVDVNPNCDLSPKAGLTRAASAAGLTHTALVNRLVRFALSRATRVTARRALQSRRSLLRPSS